MRTPTKGTQRAQQTERTALAALVDDPALASLHAAFRQGRWRRFRSTNSTARSRAHRAICDTAITHFTAAAAREHALPYTEPPYWHQPVSHLLGAALLEAGRAKEAEAVYRESLMTYRLDGWALYGLALAQDAQGHHADAEATERNSTEFGNWPT